MPLLQNVTMSTKRPPGQGIYATGIAAHIQPNIQFGYKLLPQAALESDYQATVDSGTDIVEGDLVVSMILSADNTTPWPGLGAVDQNEYFRVTYTHESDPGPLAHRKVYISRIRGGGKVY